MKLIILSVVLLATASCSNAQSSSGSREVLLDNEKVEVVRLIYPPGTESGMHTHQYPNRVVYFVKGGKLELVPGDGSQPTVIDAVDGQTLFLPAMTHNVRNIGNTVVELVETELK